MFHRFLCVLFVCGPYCSSAQGISTVGARSTALASTSVCLNDAWAYFHNPGALARVERFSAGVYYESRFLLRELQTQGLAITVPAGKGAFSLGARMSGYELYRTVRSGLGYSLALSEKVSAGIQVNAHHLRFGGNYGQQTTATAEAGLLVDLSSKWKLGASVLNIGRQRISPLNDRIATTFRLGTQYLISQKVSFLLEAEKQVSADPRFKCAVEYRPVEVLVFRFGAHNAPAQLAFGVGYRKKGCCIDLGSSWNPLLGWTPVAGFTYAPGS